MAGRVAHVTGVRVDSYRGASRRPGLRALHSERFRIIVAITLVIIGVLVHVYLLSVLSAAGDQDSHDLFAYLIASDRLLEGASPYLAGQLSGSVSSVCTDCYLYPPFLAQILTPIALLPDTAATAAWWAIQMVAMYAAVWIGTGLGGARRGLERALWCLVAVLLFFPVFLSLWYGNVSTILALGVTLVATGGAAAGLSAAAMLLIKVVPGTLAPATFLMSRSSRWSLLAGLAAMLAISFVLAPAAWLEYPGAFLNLVAGPTDDKFNFAPANLASRAGLSDTVVVLTRASTFVIGAVTIVASMWLALRQRGAPAAALMGTVAMLILPGTIWIHYFVVLVPFAAMSWPSAGPGVRVGLLGGAAAMIPGFVLTPLGFAGAVLMAVLAAWSLWPRGSAEASTARTPAGAPA